MALTKEQRLAAGRAAVEHARDNPGIAPLIDREVLALVNDGTVGSLMAAITGLPESVGTKASTTVPVSPTAVADAARKDPSYRQNVTNAIMSGVNPAVAEVRALVAYATINDLTGFLTHAELSLLPEDEFNAVWSRFGADVIRDPLFEELTPFEQFTSDPEAYFEANPTSPDAVAFREARRWESLTPEQQQAEREGKALVKSLKAQHADLLDAAMRTGAGADAVVGLDVLITQSQAGDGARKVARAIYDREQAAAKAKATEPTIADLRAAVGAGPGGQ